MTQAQLARLPKMPSMDPLPTSPRLILDVSTPGLQMQLSSPGHRIYFLDPQHVSSVNRPAQHPETSTAPCRDGGTRCTILPATSEAAGTSARPEEARSPRLQCGITDKSVAKEGMEPGPRAVV